MGLNIVSQLKELGARMVICDIDSKKVAAVKDKHTVETVMPKDVYDFDCDIFCPCALEGISTTTRFPA